MMTAATKLFSVKDVASLLGAERREVQRLLTRMAPYNHAEVSERRARGLDLPALVHLHVLMRLRVAGVELGRLEEESAALHRQVLAVIAGETDGAYEFKSIGEGSGPTVSVGASGVRISVDLHESIGAVMQYVGVAQPVQRQLPMLMAVPKGARG